jgi:hypothetical protein
LLRRPRWPILKSKIGNAGNDLYWEIVIMAPSAEYHIIVLLSIVVWAHVIHCTKLFVSSNTQGQLSMDHASME